MTFTRRLISGTFQLTLSNGIVRLLAIVTMPILTVVLSPQAYGVATLVGTVISLVWVFALAGIEIGYSRAYRPCARACRSLLHALVAPRFR